MHKWETFITVYLLFSCMFVLLACESLEVSMYHAQVYIHLSPALEAAAF